MRLFNETNMIWIFSFEKHLGAGGGESAQIAYILTGIFSYVLIINM